MAGSRAFSAFVSADTHIHDKRYLTKDKMTQTELRPADIFFDDTAVNVDTGGAFGILSCIDFPTGADGAIWFHYQLDESYLPERDINFDLVYDLDGSDDGKVVVLEASIWLIPTGQTPSEANPLVTLTENINSSSDNTNKQVRQELQTIKLDHSLYDTVDATLCIKFTRKSTSTYGGTFKMISLIAKQHWTEIL